MSKGNESAFPSVEASTEPRNLATGGGLTKRELFAAKFVAALLANPDHECTPQTCAILALKYADALLAELAKGEKP